MDPRSQLAGMMEQVCHARRVQSGIHFPPSFLQTLAEISLLFHSDGSPLSTSGYDDRKSVKNAEFHSSAIV